MKLTLHEILTHLTDGRLLKESSFIEYNCRVTYIYKLLYYNAKHYTIDLDDLLKVDEIYEKLDAQYAMLTTYNLLLIIIKMLEIDTERYGPVIVEYKRIYNNLNRIIKK